MTRHPSTPMTKDPEKELKGFKPWCGFAIRDPIFQMSPRARPKSPDQSRKVFHPDAFFRGFPTAASGLPLCSPLGLHLPDLGMPQIVKDEAKPKRKSYLHLNHTNVDISLISHTYCRKLEFFLGLDKIKYIPAYTERIRMCQLLFKHLSCLKSG